MEDNKKIARGRCYGIDLLRIIAMLLVVILHILGYGGILNKTPIGGARMAINWFMEIMAYCAVDCYALISGFVGFSDKPKVHKISRWILLWMQVVFYCLIITLGFYCVSPEEIGFKEFIKAMFPVSFNQYWYFTAYTAVFIFMPWFNERIRSVEKREALRLAILISITFSFYTTAVSIVNDPFNLLDGYSFLWLSVLYILGGVIQKYEIYIRVKKKDALMVGTILLFFTWGWKIGFGKLPISSLVSIEDIFISYISPTILGIAVILLILFAQVNIKSVAEKWIKFISPSAFSVYLIHSHPLVFENLLKGRFVTIAELSAWKIPIVVMVVSVMIFISAILIDKVREFIFKVLRMNILSQKIENVGRKIVNTVLLHFNI